MVSTGAGVQEGDDGGVPSLFLGPAMKRKRQGEQRKKKMVWGKKEKFTPAALFICHRKGSWGSW
jgi:hypothetical protein